MPLPEVEGAAAGEALLQVASQLGILLRGLGDGSRPAQGEWDVRGVAAHCSHSLDLVTALVRGCGPALGSVDDVGVLTRVLVDGESEHDLMTLAERIQASAAELVREAGESDPAAPRSWVIQDTELAVAGLLCQALNELVVHGHDIAAASGHTWTIRRDHALLVLHGYLFPVLSLFGSDLVEKEKVGGRRMCFEIRPRGGDAVFLAFEDGRLVVAESAPAVVDCRLSVDPVAFLLVAWSRQSHWGGVLRGRLLASGRRPWLGLELPALLRNP
jgi:hypothetical protein